MSQAESGFASLAVKKCGIAVVIVVAVAFLGGCMSVPALREPVPHSPRGPEKTITELLSQWADLTNAAIAATGYIDGWKDDTPLAKSKPWDPAGSSVGLAPCATTASDDASQVTAVVFHAPFENDPHPVADKLTAYWESEGFTVTRTIDWTSPSGKTSIEMRAERADGVEYGLTATTEIVAIDVLTECSADPSIHAWAEERVQQRLDTLYQTPTPSPSPSPSAGAEVDDGWVW